MAEFSIIDDLMNFFLLYIFIPLGRLSFQRAGILVTLLEHFGLMVLVLGMVVLYLGLKLGFEIGV